MEWIKNFPWSKQRFKVGGAIGYLKAMGCEQIGLLGFCYGGHLAAWGSTLDPIVRAAPAKLTAPQLIVLSSRPPLTARRTSPTRRMCARAASPQVKCGVVLHPSIQLESYA